MGNDLYWKKTPKEPEEIYSGLSYTTWHFLAELWNKDIADLSGMELKKSNIEQLKTIAFTAKESGNRELMQDMQELVKAIIEHDSITLEVRG
jgi:hypothetical protein